jgi:hypothetical protein
MSESTLRRILAIAKANPIDLIIARQLGSRKQRLAWLAKKNLTGLDLSIDMYLV